MMIQQGLHLLKAFRKEIKGQGMVEYALLIGLIAIVVIVALIFLGPQISNMFFNIGNQLNR